MPDITTFEKIKGLSLSAFEIKTLTNWPDPIIDEFLNMIQGLVKIAELLDIEIDQKLEEIKTDFFQGSIPFVSGGFLDEDNARLTWDSINHTLGVVGIISSSGRRKNVTRIDSTPYDISYAEEIIMVDTDTIDITINLPAGVDGQAYKIVNCGTSGNIVTINPNGTDLLNGVNAPETLYDSENLDLSYDSTEGWF